MLVKAIITDGYTFAAALIMALYLALRGSVRFKLEQALAFALGLGLFIVAMAFVWPSLFPTGRAVGGYAGL